MEKLHTKLAYGKNVKFHKTHTHTHKHSKYLEVKKKQQEQPEGSDKYELCSNNQGSRSSTE